PFLHNLRLHGPHGEIVRIQGVFDDSAMVNVISAEAFGKFKHWLTSVGPSDSLLKMADGSLVRSAGKWCGSVEVKGASRQGQFEVFLSGGSWDLLFGKPLLTTFNMTHWCETDEISFDDGGRTVRMPNAHPDSQANVLPPP
ncbi:hypothetical protein FIBSPDRAFT_729357, partial [Athelia psychrophila]